MLHNAKKCLFNLFLTIRYYCFNYNDINNNRMIISCLNVACNTKGVTEVGKF